MQRRSILRWTTTAAALGVAGIRPLRAQTLTKFKFNLGWRVEASGAGFLLAQQRGYYKDAGLDVTIDTGNGSAAAISLVAGDAHDAASADLRTMIEFNAANPDRRLSAVAIQHDLNPNSIIVRKNSGIVMATYRTYCQQWQAGLADPKGHVFRVSCLVLPAGAGSAG